MAEKESVLPRFDPGEVVNGKPKNKVRPWLELFKLALKGETPKNNGEQEAAYLTRLKDVYMKRLPKYLSPAAVDSLLAREAFDKPWDDVEKIMIRTWAEPAPQGGYEAELRRRNQQPGESVSHFVAVWVELVRDAGVRLEVHKEAFFAALNPEIRKKFPLGYTPQDFADVEEKAKQAEALEAESSSATSSSATPMSAPAPVMYVSGGGAFRGGARGRGTSWRGRGGGNTQAPTFSGAFWSCGRVGHKKSQCRATKSIHLVESEEQYSTNGKENRKNEPLLVCTVSANAERLMVVVAIAKQEVEALGHWRASLVGFQGVSCKSRLARNPFPQASHHCKWRTPETRRDSQLADSHWTKQD